MVGLWWRWEEVEMSALVKVEEGDGGFGWRKKMGVVEILVGGWL